MAGWIKALPVWEWSANGREPEEKRDHTLVIESTYRLMERFDTTIYAYVQLRAPGTLLLEESCNYTPTHVPFSANLSQTGGTCP